MGDRSEFDAWVERQRTPTGDDPEFLKAKLDIVTSHAGRQIRDLLNELQTAQERGDAWRDEAVSGFKAEGYRVVKLRTNEREPGGWITGYEIVEEL